MAVEKARGRLQQRQGQRRVRALRVLSLRGRARDRDRYPEPRLPVKANVGK